MLKIVGRVGAGVFLALAAAAVALSQVPSAAQQTETAHQTETLQSAPATGLSDAVERGNPFDLAVVPAPAGMSSTGVHVDSLGGTLETEDGAIDGGPALTVEKSGFSAEDRRKITVLRISGGDWVLENELSGGGVEISVADRYEGTVKDGGELTLVAFHVGDGHIVQLVGRNGVTAADLVAYAEVLVEESVK